MKLAYSTIGTLSELLQTTLMRPRRIREGGGLRVVLSSGTEIRVGSFSPDGGPDWALGELQLDGQLVGKLVVECGDDGPDYELLEELYSDAMRCLYGFDDLLNELNKSPDSEGEIWIAPIAPDDIPF